MTVALYNKPTSDDRLQEIKEATKRQHLAVTETNCAVRMAEEKNTEVQEYWNVRVELSKTDGLIMKGERLVIPTDLRIEMLK